MLGASRIACCIISLIQFLSYHANDFSKRKFFGPCTRYLIFQTTYFLFNGKNKFSYYKGRRRSHGLVYRLALYSAKCTLPVILYRAFKYHRTQYSKCEKKIRRRSVDCMNQAHMTRKIEFLRKSKRILYRPSEGSRRLRLPGLWTGGP